MEIEIPDKDVLLSDFDLWCFIIRDILIPETEEEDTELEQKNNSLPSEEQWKMKSKNWEAIFNLDSAENGWLTKGDSIQATFWELKKDQMRDVRFFTAARPKL